MISYVYEYWWIYDYMVVWVCMLYVIWCVVLCDIVSVVICMYMVILALCGYVMLWSQIDIYMCDMILCYMCGFCARCKTGIFACSFEYYVWLYLMLCYVVMCVYVDNYVDNSSIYVDNFLLQMQHFLRTFWKYCIFACFRALSLVISCLLLLSLFFIILP